MFKCILFFSFILFFSCKDERLLTDEDLYRPKLHFSAREKWTGEPTGLVFYNGRYHIYYQYNSKDSYFGNVSWGHAISDDLIHWKELPIAIPFDSLRHNGSGSIIVDSQNISKLSESDVPPFISFYVKYEQDNNKSVYISYSLDEGETWKEYPKPVLSFLNNDIIRNPKVKWNNVLNQWLMTISNGESILFYTSQDCLYWKYHSQFDCTDNLNGWESSDFFSLKDPVTGGEKWILLISMNYGPTGENPAIRYFVGDFDKEGFHPIQKDILWVDYGRDYYAGMTFNHLKDSRTILMAWMNCWSYANLLPTVGWNGSWAIPKEVNLGIENNGSYMLTFSPVKELEQYRRTKEHIAKNLEFSKTYVVNREIQIPSEWVLTFDVTSRNLLFAPSKYGIRFKTESGHKLEVGYNSYVHSFYIEQSKRMDINVDYLGDPIGASYLLKQDTVEWKILLDNNSIEFLGVNGKVSLSSLQYADGPFVEAELFSEKGKTRLINGDIYFY